MQVGVCAGVLPGSGIFRSHQILRKVTSLCCFSRPPSCSVSGDAVFYRSLTTLARALAQYLAVLSRLPGHLQLPPEKEPDTVKFVVMTLEVSGHSGTRRFCDWRCQAREEGTFNQKQELCGPGSSSPHSHPSSACCQVSHLSLTFPECFHSSGHGSLVIWRYGTSDTYFRAKEGGL